MLMHEQSEVHSHSCGCSLASWTSSCVESALVIHLLEIRRSYTKCSTLYYTSMEIIAGTLAHVGASWLCIMKLLPRKIHLARTFSLGLHPSPIVSPYGAAGNGVRVGILPALQLLHRQQISRPL